MLTRCLYTGLLRLALPLALARLHWRARILPAYRHRIAERLALERAPACRADLWIHAVSVGEVQAAAGLIRSLLARAPAPRILVTTTTPTGAARLAGLFGDRVAHRYTPYDLPGILERFLGRIRPRLLVILETEIWPNTLAACARHGIPAVLVNARLSARSARGYARVGGLTRATLDDLALIAAQTEDDARRFVALGADPARVRVIGNLKFDDPPPDPALAARAATLRRSWGGGTRPAWIAASTHAGEDEPILAVHRRLLERNPATLLVLVPRHPERFERVAALIESAGLRLARRSQPGDDPATAQVLLGDTMGELTTFLAAGDAAFIGGSLVPVGGHNVLEAAAAGVPVVTGPETFNFAAICEALVAAGGAARVADADGLAAILAGWLADPLERARVGANGRQFVERNRGALERLLGLLEPWLDRAS